MENIKGDLSVLWSWRQQASWNHWYLYTNLHVFTAPQTQIFIITTVKTSHLTQRLLSFMM